MKRMIAKLMLLLSLVFFVCTEVEAAKRNIKEWTFMIFMNGDNNLDQSAVKDLKEIRSKGSSNEFMNVVVMIDREKRSRYNLLRRRWKARNTHQTW